MTDQKIERSDGRGFGRQQVLANSIENFIQHDKKVLAAARNLQSIKILLSLELSQCRKSASMLSPAWSEQVAETRGPQRLPQTWKMPVFVLARPTRPSRAGDWSQELGCWFGPLSLWLPSGPAFGKIARWPAGAQTWTQTWTLPPDRRVQVVKVLSAPKSQVS